jgi:hypothetical protein
LTGNGVKERRIPSTKIIMIQFNIPSIALSAALLIPGALAASNDDCSTHQENKNTTISVQNGSLTQSFPVCEKGLIKSIEIDASVEFTGESPVRVEILDESGNTVAERLLYADEVENGLSLHGLNIHTAGNTQMTLKVGADQFVKVIFDATTTSNSFVGSMSVDGESQNQNIAFGVDIDAFIYSAIGGVIYNGSNIDNWVQTENVDFHAEGECQYKQITSSGVMAFEGTTLMQSFNACSRGELTEFAISAAYVQPGKDFSYSVLNADFNLVCEGVFTSDNFSDGVLRIPLCEENVRTGMRFFIRIGVDGDERIALHVTANNNEFVGKMYVNGQPQPLNLTFSAGVDVALASLEAAHDYAKVTTIEAYPVPFGSELNIGVNGEIAQGASLELIDSRGNVHYAVSLAASEKGARLNMVGLSNMVRGVYALRLINGREVVTMQVIKK